MKTTGEEAEVVRSSSVVEVSSAEVAEVASEAVWEVAVEPVPGSNAEYVSSVRHQPF